LVLAGVRAGRTEAVSQAFAEINAVSFDATELPDIVKSLLLESDTGRVLILDRTRDAQPF